MIQTSVIAQSVSAFRRISLPFLAMISLPIALQATEIIAHRGFSTKAPENTVSAFKQAWEHKTDACELDMYLTADGQIAILHDNNTKRTTGVAKAVKDSTMAELQTLDAGSWKNQSYKGEKIPTLAEALETMPQGQQRFFLEVKCGSEIIPVLAKELSAWKARSAQICLITFNRKVAQECKKALPWFKVYRISDGKKNGQAIDLAQLITDTKADGLDGLDLAVNGNWNEEMVKKIKSAGLELYVWTVNDSKATKRMAQLGVDGITTNDPVMVRATLQEK